MNYLPSLNQYVYRLLKLGHTQAEINTKVHLLFAKYPDEKDLIVALEQAAVNAVRAEAA